MSEGFGILATFNVAKTHARERHKTVLNIAKTN
jgi:hypothetical protein